MLRYLVDSALKFLNTPALFIAADCASNMNLFATLTLPNSIDGIIFYLVPDFSQINLNIAGNALGQAFFSLSLGMGMLITYGSYVDDKNNIVNSAALITLADVGIAFLSGLIIFPFVFSSGIETQGGAGLIFEVFPKIFENLGNTTGIIVGSTFFILLSFAAITSTVSLLEVPVSYLVDEYKVDRKYSVWIVAITILIIGIPSALSQGKYVFFSEFITYFGSDKSIDFMQFIIDISNDTLMCYNIALYDRMQSKITKSNFIDFLNQKF